jgi:cold shock CspA family protein
VKIVGKVLWWDRKDLNGIIVDSAGNEIYFDISVVEGHKASAVKRGTIVQFQINEKIDRVACAKLVVVPPSKSKSRLEKEFNRNLQLTFQFAEGA